MHGEPSEAWTLDSLCERTGTSRSSLHDRFVHFIGQPPMQYLTQWRMQVASGMLCESTAKVIEVAMSVGYESEPAFSRAFKRVAGMSPGAWRKVRRAHANPVLEPVAV
jgi:AraC-like DNA-binding protein